MKAEQHHGETPRIRFGRLPADPPGVGLRAGPAEVIPFSRPASAPLPDEVLRPSPPAHPRHVRAAPAALLAGLALAAILG